MKIGDARKLDHKTLEEIRIRAVRQVLAGESPESVIKALGFHRSRIYQWLALYKEGGEKALRAKKIEGRPCKLQEKQANQLFDIIAQGSPLQYHFAFALWTVSLIRELIQAKFSISLSEVSVWRILKRIGLSPQRPLFRAYQQDPQSVNQYLKTEYPTLKKRAKKLKASIFFADEASIRSDYHSGTTWAPIGKTPIVKTTGARFRINMISAVSARGELRFMLTDKGLTAPIFIEFLQRLVKGCDNPIFLIVDGHPVHHSKKVKDFVETLNGQLELHFLPGYSPELNPDESVWGYVKYHHVGKSVITGPDQFKSLVLGALRKLQKLPDTVASFFKAKTLQYAMS
jgi:transposase